MYVYVSVCVNAPILPIYVCIYRTYLYIWYAKEFVFIFFQNVETTR